MPPRELAFTKMHGAGNDVVVIDGIQEELPVLEPLARRLLDRRFGIGGDQLLVARPSSSADFRMDIYNPDGSRAEMCANGIRTFYLWLRANGHTQADEVAIETLKGIVRPRHVGAGVVAVDMGLPILAPEKIPTKLGAGTEGPVLEVPLEVDGQTLTVSSVSMGNPHCVVEVADVEAAAVGRLGPAIEHHPAFPNRVNVEFIEVVTRGRVRQRTWERGTGETLACGSGACAVAVTSILRGRTERELDVELRGGTLRLAWPADDAAVIMTGPAVEVFRGRIPLGEGV